MAISPSQGRDRPEWQCRFADVLCTNPRVTLISGHIHDLCEEHRVRKTPSVRRLDSEPTEDTSSDDWEYQPMNGGGWKITSQDLVPSEPSEVQTVTRPDGVVYASLFFHADAEVLRACSFEDSR